MCPDSKFSVSTCHVAERSDKFPNMTELSTTEPDVLRTVREACVQLRVGKTKLYELMASGDLKSIPLPTASGQKPRRRIRQSAIDAFIASCGDTSL